jgi:hypothetical protein
MASEAKIFMFSASQIKSFVAQPLSFSIVNRHPPKKLTIFGKVLALMQIEIHLFFFHQYYVAHLILVIDL